MRFRHYFVYVMVNWNNKVMYIGMTNNLIRRISEHKNKCIPGCFTKRYNITKLVYYEIFQDVNLAIRREKELKKWRREKKNRLVESANPGWEEMVLE